MHHSLVYLLSEVYINYSWATQVYLIFTHYRLFNRHVWAISAEQQTEQQPLKSARNKPYERWAQLNSWPVLFHENTEALAAFVPPFIEREREREWYIWNKYMKWCTHVAGGKGGFKAAGSELSRASRADPRISSFSGSSANSCWTNLCRKLLRVVPYLSNIKLSYPTDNAKTANPRQ